MRMNRAIAAGAVVAAGLVGLAPAASADSFYNRPLGGGVYVSYDDGADRFCIRMDSNAYFDVASLNLYSVTAGRGPSHTASVNRGQKQCRSLATAYEDSAYRYFGNLDFFGADRSGHRYGGDFFS
jgi:hypothetical protein